MPSLFKINPTPPTAAKLAPGEAHEFSFTVHSLAAPDKVHDILLDALIVPDGGKGKQADWLSTESKQGLIIPGGKTLTVTITARPKPTTPRGEHMIKLVVAEKDHPHDLFDESQPVACEVYKPPPPPHPHWWLILAIAGGVIVLGAGGWGVWEYLIRPPQPVASTIAEPRSGPVPLTVKFQDTSAGKPSKVAWSFGDGSPISEERNPHHTYQKPGVYEAELTASSKHRDPSTARFTVTALPPVTASGEPLSGRVPLTVAFRHTSTGNPSKVTWNFDDGSPVSRESSPRHTYRSPGTYNVVLTAVDDHGTTTTARVTVTALPETLIAASAEPLTGSIPLTVAFRHTSTGNPSKVTWNFDDGSPLSAESSPRHTYRKAGQYNVVLTVDDQGTTKTARVTVTALPEMVIAASGEPLTGRVPLTVALRYTSTGNPTSVTWNFGDGSPISVESNPRHTYARPGTYTVVLTGRDNQGATAIATLAVAAQAVPPPPVARFVATPQQGPWPLEVSFEDRSQNAIPGTEWAWQFGDGMVSRQQSPRHRFEAPGAYTVTLRVWNANGESALQSMIRVSSRYGELHPDRVGPFGGPFGAWATQFARCPAQTIAYGFSDKVEPSLRDGDDTALNGIQLWCVKLPNTQSNSFVTSSFERWGQWSPRLDCRDQRSYIKGARLRVEPSLGGGDDTGAVDIEFRCSNGTVLSNGGHAWGAWKEWDDCPANTAICGIKTKVEAALGGDRDDTALNDVEFQCCYVQ